MRRFKELWQAIKDHRKVYDFDDPMATNALPIIRWTEDFCDHLHQCIGVGYIPFTYIICEEGAVPSTVAILATNQP